MYRLLMAAALLAPAAAFASCGTAPKLAELRVTSPLLATQPDTSQVVSIFADGCVNARFPKHDRRHGEVALQLRNKELQQLTAEIRASGVERIDPAALRDSLRAEAAKQADTTRTLWRVTDEDIVEFVFAEDGDHGHKRLVFNHLRSDLLNRPDHPDLAAVAALEQLFVELGERAARGKQQEAVQ